MVAPRSRGLRSHTPPGMLRVMPTFDAWRRWSSRRWLTALVAGLTFAVLVALPTAVIPNPIFGRSIEVTWWSYPVVLASAVLAGLLIATYIREPGAEETDKAAKVGTVGGFLAFFAVGCPVCNKLVLLALGTSGAMTWFAPVQPFLALAAVLAMAWAVRMRVRGMKSCEIPQVAADSST